MKRSAMGVVVMLGMAIPAALAAPPGVEGTAHIRLRRVTVFEGKDFGAQRSAINAQIDVCNGIRAGFYQLPPVRPEDSMLAALDTQTIDKYFDGDKAATHVTGHQLVLTDQLRWTLESRGGEPKPARPPDCAAARLDEVRSGTLWVDGIKRQLRYDTRRALPVPDSGDFRPRALLPEADFGKLPFSLYLGQGCREVVAPLLVEFAGGRACIWSAFPFVAYLNLPWALQAERRFGMPEKLHQVDSLQLVERNRAIDPGIFRPPAGFLTEAR